MSAPHVGFGRQARALWSLRDDASFLNHGSYGACPRPVQAAQEALRREAESHPDAFMARISPVGDGCAVRHALACLHPFAGVSADHLALVENATTGVHVALQSAFLAPGDEILATNHQYNAVRLAIEARCRASGAVPRVISLPLPATAADITQRILDGLRPRTRLVVLDHLSSPSALVFPLQQLIPEFARREIPVLIDGAHALGQLPLQLAALDADWYVANAHKWLYAARGTAVLHAAPRVAAQTRPLVTSHHIALGFPRSFDYVGTRDYTAWLALPVALAFHEQLGFGRLDRHNAQLVDEGTAALQAAGAEPAGPRTMCAWMRAFILPQHRSATPADASAVTETLWQRDRIQIRCAVLDGKLLLRFCAQAYVDADELRQLGDALRRHGWPARNTR